MWLGPLTVTVSPSELQRKRTKRLNDFALHRIFLEKKGKMPFTEDFYTVNL